jgi:hypothetical protein
MRTLLAVLALTLAIPATASADTVGTATTSTGQTLTVTIDSPADGATLPSIVFDMTGHATLSAAPDGGQSTSIDRLEPGLGDGYGKPGAGAWPRAQVDPDTGAWSVHFGSAIYGTHRFYATVVAADGTQATANITITLPKYPQTVSALPVFSTQGTASPGPALRASVFYLGRPAWGWPVDFYVKGEKVCSAGVGNVSIYATCSDPVAVTKAIVAGGYDAVIEETDWSTGDSDHAGLF